MRLLFRANVRMCKNAPVSSFFPAVCEYFVHIECQDFAVADCKENATYLPGKDLSAVKHTHHWREGNLPNNSKCALCKKSCFSAECLSGFRCEWCGITVKKDSYIYTLRRSPPYAYLSPPFAGLRNTSPLTKLEIELRIARIAESRSAGLRLRCVTLRYAQTDGSISYPLA